MITVVLSEVYGASYGQQQGDVAAYPCFEVFDQADSESFCVFGCGSYDNNDGVGGAEPDNKARDGTLEGREDEVGERDECGPTTHPPLSPASVTGFTNADPLVKHRTDTDKSKVSGRNFPFVFPQRMVMQIESMRPSVHFSTVTQIEAIDSRSRISLLERQAIWYRKSQIKNFRHNMEESAKRLQKGGRILDTDDDLIVSKEWIGDDSDPCAPREIEFACLGLKRTLHQLTAQAILFEQQHARLKRAICQATNDQSSYHGQYSSYCRKARLTQFISVLEIRRRYWRSKRLGWRQELLAKDRLFLRGFCYTIIEDPKQRDVMY